MSAGPFGEFHHIGIACESVDASVSRYAVAGYAVAGEPFVDPAQGIRGLFLEGGGPRLELLEELPGSRVLQPWMGAGARMYHLAFEVTDLRATLERAVVGGGRISRPPTPSVAFGGRAIAFVLFPGRTLYEFIEAAS